MDFAETKTCKDVLDYIREHHGIHKTSLPSMYYGMKLRPKKTPKLSDQIEYINSNIKEFKEYVAGTFNIDEPIGCGKRRLTEYASRKALANSLLSWDSRRQEKRRYYCKKCEAWHLTSKPNHKLNYNIS